jgi:ABC-type uncharacterized transport system involved in gliding motility auxiliary subunit
VTPTCRPDDAAVPARGQRLGRKPGRRQARPRGVREQTRLALARLALAIAGRETEPPANAERAEIPVVATGRFPRGEADDAREARMVVIGDRDFASNRLLEALYNRDLFMNAIRWLANDETRIALGDKGWTPNQDPLTLQQTVAYFYFLAFALPEALLLLGIFAWWRQRG